MLTEIVTNQFKIYTQSLRTPKDDYTRRKIQKDRQKLLVMLNGLLNDREVILFYKDGAEEKQVVVTRKNFIEKEILQELPTAPRMIEIINNTEVEEVHHIVCWQIPLREVLSIHLDDITKFIVWGEGLTYEFYLKLKNDAN